MQNVKLLSREFGLCLLLLQIMLAYLDVKFTSYFSTLRSQMLKGWLRYRLWPLFLYNELIILPLLCQFIFQ